MEGVSSETSKTLLRRLLDDQKLKYCQDCGTCTASCPMAKAIPNQYNPRRLLMKIYIDLDAAVQGEDLWLCAWCYRCTERCPQGLEPTEIFLLTRNFAAEKDYLPENPRRLLQEIMKSGRSMAAPEYVDELRQEYALPKIGSVISDEVLGELHKIMGESFERRVEKRT